MELDTLNHFGVGSTGDRLVILLAPARNRALTNTEALNLAAWLLAMTGAPRAEFLALVEAIENT